MSRNRHIVHMEPLQVQVLRHGALHHLQIRSRPRIGVLHGKYLVPPLLFRQFPQPAGLKIIAQVGVRQIPVIISEAVVVVGKRGYTLLCKKPRQRIGHIVVRAFAHAVLPVGNQACTVDVLPVAGACLPQRHIVILKHKTTVT